MSLVLAKKQIEIDYFNHGTNQLITKENALKAVEIASIPDWKYPEKNEFPEIEKQVLFITENLKYQIGFYNKKYGYFYFMYNEIQNCFSNVIQWCELPVLNKA